MFRLLLCSLLILWAELHAVPQVPKLKLWATDLTGTLSSSELDYLNSRLKTFQDSTSNQLVFLMIPSLEGDALEDYTYRVAKKTWSAIKTGITEYFFLFPRKKGK